MKYIQGQVDSSGARILPFNDEVMKYNFDTHKYEPDVNGIQEVIKTFDLSKFKGGEIGATDFLEDKMEQVYEYIYANPYNYAQEVKEFFIGRTLEGREGLKQAFIRQVRYALQDGADLDEWAKEDMPMSKRALNILNEQRYFILGHKGSFRFRVNPDATDNDGYRNGY